MPGPHVVCILLRGLVSNCTILVLCCSSLDPILSSQNSAQSSHIKGAVSKLHVVVDWCPGIGAYKFHILALTRSVLNGCLAHHMFVSDTKGRILHVTRALAALLGSTPKEILLGGAQHALEKILPEPFSNMHRKWGVSCRLRQPEVWL